MSYHVNQQMNVDYLTWFDVKQIDPFDTKFDLHLFLQATTVIGRNKSRDLISSITVAALQK